MMLYKYVMLTDFEGILNFCVDENKFINMKKV